jgi:transcriptional regulator with XRE-family HTH domain
LLDLPQDDLAAAAGVLLSTVWDFEKGRQTPIPAALPANATGFRFRGFDFLSTDEEASGITFPALSHKVAGRIRAKSV